MKREVKLLLNSGLDSLLLAIEHFNRPVERGRVVSVLMSLNHGFEMLLKAVIIHKGGKIRERRAKETIGFDRCTRKCLSDSQIKCLNEEQALTIQMINSLRDAATHYLLDISEEQFYMHVQSGVTLFSDILLKVFETKLVDYLPQRVLPISVKPPNDLFLLIDEQVKEIKKILISSKRKLSQAKHKLRPIAIMENSIRGDSTQPSDGDLNRILRRLAQENDWQSIFPGVASFKINTEGEGLNISLRITKDDGVPIRLVKEEEENGLVVAVRRVNELDYYSLSVSDIARKLNLNVPKTLALVHYFGIQDREEYFKKIKIGSSAFKRYSPKVLNLLRSELPKVDINEIWIQYNKHCRKEKLTRS